MVALGPDNMKWRMEEQYADFDLGVLLYDQRRFAEAAAQFGRRPEDDRSDLYCGPFEQRLSEIRRGIACLARRTLGRQSVNMAPRSPHASTGFAFSKTLFEKRGDVDFRQRLIPAHRSLGNLYEETGGQRRQCSNIATAIAHADALTNVEPDNAVMAGIWLSGSLDLASQLMADGQLAEASSADGRGMPNRLALAETRSPSADWQKGLITCSLTQGGLALKSGAKAQARNLHCDRLRRHGRCTRAMP